MPWSLRMTLLAYSVAIIPYLYVGWRLTNALIVVFPTYSRIIKLGIPIIFLFLNLLPLVILIFHFFGNLDKLFLFNSNLTFLDFFLLFPFWIGLILMLEIFSYFIILDFIQLAKKIIPTKIDNWDQWFAILKIFLFLIFLSYVSIRVYIDSYHVRISEYAVQIKDKHASLYNLNLALISDVQVDRYTQESKMKSLSKSIDKSDPDILFFAGDLVTRGENYISQGINFLCELNSKVARVACLGDHDIWSDPERIINGLQQCNWTFLVNKHHIIEHKGCKILITGITYAYSEKISAPALNQLMEKAPEADLKILLVHQPAAQVLEITQKYGYDFCLAGHTHGGQIVIKPLGITITPTQFENKWWSGHHLLSNLHLFITNGLGLTALPLRYQAPAEVLKIKITH